MKDMQYVLANFFTHKDFLVPAAQIPGTIFTPLHFCFAAALAALIFVSAFQVSRRRKLVKPVLASVWALMVVWEFVIIYWDSTAGKNVGFDPVVNLSLYPCSLYLYTLPFALWGKDLARKASCGYLCTLGLLGASVNFLFPLTRLIDYSCISFPGLHTFSYHGAMLFTFLVLILSGEYRYEASSLTDLVVPAIPTLLLSIPANLINYTLGADYMFFRGEFAILARIFGDTPPMFRTLTLYVLYILVPALFYIPSFRHNRQLEEEESLPALAGAEYL